MHLNIDPTEPVVTSKSTSDPDGDDAAANAEHGQSWRDTDEDPWGTADEAPPPVIGN